MKREQVMLLTGMNRAEFRSLSTDRLDDAKALLDAGRYTGAYYVSGYAVECALKACIARLTKEDEFPQKDSAKFYTHDLARLLEFAGLGSAFDEEARRDPEFRANWAVVKDWTEQTRYQERNQSHAEEILTAISDPAHEVAQWLRRNW